MCDGIYPESAFEKVAKGTANQRPKNTPKGSNMVGIIAEPEAEPEPGRLKSIAATRVLCHTEKHIDEEELFKISPAE